MINEVTMTRFSALFEVGSRSDFPPPARAAMLAFCKLAGPLWGKGFIFNMSVRRLAEAAGLDKSTAERAITWLQQTQYIKRVLRGGPGQADSYFVGQRFFEVIAGFGTDEINDSSISSVPFPTLAPVWDGGALGYKTAVVYFGLTDEPRAVLPLSKLVGLGRWAVTSALEKLRAVNLAVETDGGWIVGPGTLDEAAEALNVTGVKAARRERHAADREAFGERLVKQSDDSRNYLEYLWPISESTKRDQYPMIEDYAAGVLAQFRVPCAACGGLDLAFYFGSGGLGFIYCQSCGAGVRTVAAHCDGSIFMHEFSGATYEGVKRVYGIEDGDSFKCDGAPGLVEYLTGRYAPSHQTEFYDPNRAAILGNTTTTTPEVNA